MTILLFVLTAVLVGYVVYTFYTSDAGQSSGRSAETEPEAPAQPAPVQKPAPKAKKPTASKPAEPATTETEPPATGSEESGPSLYRNPETGETAAIPSNYRFAKRWIKEALVAEGLLDKVYKNNELDRTASKKVKTALDKLKELKKYHA